MIEEIYHAGNRQAYDCENCQHYRVATNPPIQNLFQEQPQKRDSNANKNPFKRIVSLPTIPSWVRREIFGKHAVLPLNQKPFSLKIS